jgi:ABC-type enterochelin transport system substrate-binding protein
MKLRITIAVAAAVMATLLAACGNSAAGTTETSTTTVVSTNDATTSTLVPAGDPGTLKVSANTASVDEIAAALEAAGVDNADRWAREVAEYRPYATDDPDLTHLRDELAKYNPASGVVDSIVSVLTP